MSSVTFNAATGVMFCCGNGYDESSNNCTGSTRQMGRAPFTIPRSHIIFNRTTGSTIFPGAVPAAASTTVGTATSTKHDVAVGLGVGIPLLIVTLVALGLPRRERRLRMKLAKNPGSAPPPPPSTTTTVLVSMSTKRIYEFDGAPVVKELAAS